MPKNEIILDKQNKFITRYGSMLDEEYPSVVYLRTKSKITPIWEKKDYNAEVTNIKAKFSEFIQKAIKQNRSVDSNYFLFNIDISSKSIGYGKQSFLRYDLYVKPCGRKTIEENKYRLCQLSTKLDKKLESLLNKDGIICQ